MEKENSGGNQLTQVHLEKWPLKRSVCVCVFCLYLPSIFALQYLPDCLFVGVSVCLYVSVCVYKGSFNIPSYRAEERIQQAQDVRDAAGECSDAQHSGCTQQTHLYYTVSVTSVSKSPVTQCTEITG